MKVRVILLICLALVPFEPSKAVTLSPQNEGQVLIFPYVSALGGNDTLISISTDGEAKALKVYFRDVDGEISLSFNLYLGQRDTWVAALTQVDDQVQLAIGSPNCTLPNLGSEGSSLTVPITSGFLEVFEMGSVVDEDLDNAVETHDCSALASMWEPDGAWLTDPTSGLMTPEGGLRGNATLINVQEGNSYSFVAKALTQFTDQIQHSAPDATHPDLSSAHDAGTDAGETTSRLCFDDTCIEDTWATPVQAVSAALVAHQLSGEYSVEAEIGAQTEVILTYPLQRFLLSTGASLNILDRTGSYLPPNNICPPGIPCVATTYIGNTFQSMFFMSFSDSAEDEGEVLPLDILGENHEAFFPNSDTPEIPTQGTFDLYFSSPNSQSNSGRDYWGKAVLGLVLQRYTNGHLHDDQGRQVRANYGNALELRREQDISD